MITESTVYWILKLNNIIDLCIGLLIPSSITSLVLLVVYVLACDADDTVTMPKLRRFLRISVPISILLAFIVTFLPNTKQMAMIKVIPAIANSEIAEEMSKDAKELYKMGVDAIKEQLTSKELKKDD